MWLATAAAVDGSGPVGPAAVSEGLSRWHRRRVHRFDLSRVLCNDPRVTVEMLLGMCNSIYHWYDPAGRIGPQQLADQVLGMIFSGLRPR